MPDVTHNPAGYTGTVDEIAESRRWGLAAPPFRVPSVSDWALSADLVTNRQVDIAAGEGLAYGVDDRTTAAASLGLAPNNGSTNRFDAIVATFAWAANSGAGLAAHTVSFRVVQGTTSPPAVNVTTTIDNTKINRVKGIQYDALLGVVKVRPAVGILSSGDVTDCRMWAGYEGFANVPTAANLTLMDTQPGSLVHAVDTDIVWNRLTGGAWGFEKFVGTDKTKEPMMTARILGTSIAPSVSTTIHFADVIDHSSGLLTNFGASGTTSINANVYGRVRVEAHAFSDSLATSPGGSHLDMTFPAGGGNYLSTLSDERQRSIGYGGAGQLRQTITTGPLLVAPSDAFGLNVFQYNEASANYGYDVFLTVTYV